jgi:endonuclease/exonuclease/phosphatase family metal-dependent hydrolase
MKILSWNILASEWIKKCYYKKVKDHILFNRNQRFKTIFSKINQEDPDIILLQEVMKLEYASLKRHLGHKYHISPIKAIKWQYNPNNKSNTKHSESGNITLLKKSLFPYYSSAIIHRPLDFGIYTKCLYKNEILTIFNIHLDDLSSKIRLQQLTSLKPLFSIYCIIGGDFNQVYRKSSKLYKLSGFKVHNSRCNTYYIDRKINIDNILTKGLKLIKSKHLDCEYVPDKVEDGFNIYASDHLPIKLHLE